MCTAICVTNKNFYFGRNLDYEHTFGEKVTITPRFFPFSFLNSKVIKKHYAFIGMALPYEWEGRTDEPSQKTCLFL